MQFVPEKAKWDIKNPANYPENHGDKSCAKFLDRIASDVNFNFENSAFPSAVGSREEFFSHVCDSEEKAIGMITRVGEIIKALLDRAKLIPGLIHSNNMLWRRGELLRRLLEHYGNLAQKLEDEMRVLLNQLAYMAFQLHTLMNALNLQYNPATGQLTDNKKVLVDKERTELLGIDNRMKDLLEILGSIASGSLYGQKLLLESSPRFSMTFKNTKFDSADKDGIAKELASILIDIMKALGGSPLTAEDIIKFTGFKKGPDDSLIVLVQLDTEFSAQITEEQRKILQMAMFQIAFTTPEAITGFPVLNALYAAEAPKLPEFEIPGLIPIPENSPEEWTDALKKDFALDVSKFSGARVTKKPTEAAAVVGGGGRSSVPPSPLGTGSLKINGDMSNDAKLLAFYRALIAKNPALAATLTLPMLKESGVTDEPPTSAVRGSSVARRRSARRGSGRRRQRGSARRSKYQANLLVDYVALAALLKELGTDVGSLIPVTSEDVWAAIQEATPGSPEEEPLVGQLQLLGSDAANRALLEDVEEGLADDAPFFIRLSKGEKLALGLESANQMVAGLTEVVLDATTTSKAKMLAAIKALAESSEVKEFIRVRPYNDKDSRATELQLSTVDQLYDRSPDPSVIQGQLATMVKYIESCLDFTQLFLKNPKDNYFDKFQAFLPKNRNKIPKKEEWFSTVNGGVFFEPESYLNPSRSEDGKGVGVVKTDMLAIRKLVKADIKYGWIKKDKTETTNDDPDKSIIVAKTAKSTTISELRPQLKTVPAFADLFKLWSGDIISRSAQLKSVLQTESDPQKKSRLQAAIDELPKPTEDQFLDEYYKTRVLSESINAEFVDTVWPVLQIFFGIQLEDGTRSPDTKNIVTLFYGASGSGKTFSAEAILKKCFDEIRSHQDEFQLKIVSDYNDDLFDYYSSAANLKRLQNVNVMNSVNVFNQPNGAKRMKLQSYDEMAERADNLKVSSSTKVPKPVFWEGNTHALIKADVSKGDFLKSLGVYQSGIYEQDVTKAATEAYKLSSKDVGIVADENLKKPEFAPLIKSKQTDSIYIPKDEEAFANFKADFERRVVEFRSVTDTGLNPESSRSHLLYIIIRKTKNDKAMDPKERGAQFILADFAGTEDLNYLMTEETAWPLWQKWATEQKYPASKINGDCKVAGKDVTHDWACLDLPAFAKGKVMGTSDAINIKAFNKALVDAWKAIKIKTLVANEISQNPAPPKDITSYKKQLTDKWTENLKIPFYNPGYPLMDPNDQSKQQKVGDEPLWVIKPGFYTAEEAAKALNESFNIKIKAGLPDAVKEKQKHADITAQEILEPKNNIKRQKFMFELNPNRFRLPDEQNDAIIANMVLAMHAESRHINDSLSEITTLIKAQREAVDKDPINGKADIETLKKEGKLTKNIITQILADAVTAGSAAVTIGAMNPRRTNDWETYKTMVNITSMAKECNPPKK